MKINEVTEASKYAVGDEGGTQFDKIKRVQQMKRAGVDTKDAARDIGRSQYAGIDPEDLQGKKIISRSKKELDDYKAQLQRQAGIEDSIRKKEEEERRRREERRDKQLYKDQDKRSRAQKDIDARRKFDKKVNKTSADRRGLKRGSDGRILKDPRFYGKNDSRGKERGAIGKAVDRVLTDPAYAVSSYYKDAVDNVKDFLNTRI